jgi:hypothetical protein
VRYESLFGINLVDNLGIRKKGEEGEILYIGGSQAGEYW